MMAARSSIIVINKLNNLTNVHPYMFVGVETLTFWAWLDPHVAWMITNK